MISEAIKHLKFRFGQDRITISEKDISALNNIIKTFNQLEKKVLEDNILFQKMYINEFLSQAIRNGKDGKDAEKEIERIVKIPLEQMYWTLENETPNIKLSKEMKKIGYREIYGWDIEGNMTIENSETQENNANIISENYDELKKIIGTNIDFDRFKTHIQANIARLVSLYSRK